MSDPYGDPDAFYQAMLELVMGGGAGGLGAATPTLYPSQYNLFGGLVPGDEDILEYNRDATNYAQDRNQMLADPLVGAMAGSGAYAPGQFEPITKTTQYTSPELDTFLSYLRNPQSYMGIIANKLQREGVTADEAVGFLRDQVAQNPDSPEAQALMSQMPHPFNPVTNAEVVDQVDWGRVTEDARRVESLYFEIPTEGPYEQQVDAEGNIISSGGERAWTYDEQGNPLALMQTSYEPTEAMEDYDRLGLSYPTEQFTTEMLVGPQQAADVGQFFGQGPAVTAQGQPMPQPLGASMGMAPMNEAYLRLLESQQDLRDFQPGNYTAAARGGLGGQGQAQPQPAPGIPEVAPPVPGYPPSPIDVTGEVSTALADAINNRTDAEWMAQNWESLPERERTNAREVLASYGLSPQLYGIEVREPEEHPGVVETIGSVLGGSGLEGAPVSGAGYIPGEVTAQLEGVMTTPQGAESWLAGNYARLGVEEQAEARTVLANYGLTVEDLLPGGAPQAQGFMGPRTLGNAPLPEGSVSYAAPRDYAGPVPGRTFYPTGEEPPEDWLAGLLGNEPEPPPGYPREASGYNFIRYPQDDVRNQILGQQPLPPYAQQGAEQARQPGQPGTYAPVVPRDWLAGLLGNEPGAPRPPTDAMLRMLLPGNEQRSTDLPPYARQGAEQARQPGETPYAVPGSTTDWLAGLLGNEPGAELPPYARPGAEPARQPGDPGTYAEAMLRYTLPEIETGERTAAERRQLAERNAPTAPKGAASILGGTTDRTGRGGRVKRNRERFNKEFQGWLTQRNQLLNEDYGRAAAQAFYLRQQGITPTMAQIAARQLVPQAMGIVSPGELRR